MPIHLILIYIILVALASEAIIRAWTHENGIFEKIRNSLTEWLYDRSLDRVAFLINCKLCLSYWLILILWLIVYITTYEGIVFVLATIRLADIIRGYVKN